MSEQTTTQEENLESIDDIRLENAQVVRHDIINALTSDESGKKYIPTDKDSVYMILAAAKDSDSSIYKKKRLTVDAVSAEADRMAAETISKMFGADGAKRQPSGNAPGAPAAPRAIGQQLPKFDVPTTVADPLGSQVDINIIKTEGRRVFKNQQEEDSTA